MPPLGHQLGGRPQQRRQHLPPVPQPPALRRVQLGERAARVVGLAPAPRQNPLNTAKVSRAYTLGLWTGQQSPLLARLRIHLSGSIIEHRARASLLRLRPRQLQPCYASSRATFLPSPWLTVKPKRVCTASPVCDRVRY